MATKKLKVSGTSQFGIFNLPIVVLAGKNLVAKNSGGKSDPYCELVVLDDQGNKIGKAQTTKVIKGDLNPGWNHILEL